MTQSPRFLSRLRWLDSGLLITLALCAFALWPLLARPGLPNGDDVLYHVYRAAEMDRSWSHGVLIPQWAESFYTGYGAPVFHYYASLTYYITSIFTRLFGFDAVNSLRLLIALCMFGAGAGMYAFTRRTSGKAGGIIAALCYVYSPYFLFTEPYSRGAYPELLAFALFPALMLAFSSLISNRTLRTRYIVSLPLNFALAALLEGALIISHNLMALVLTGLLVGWLVWGFVSETLQGRRVWRSYGLALAAVALGVGLAAYFWLPVVLEGSAVKLSNLTGLAELNYRNFFVPFVHLFELNPRVDAGAFNGLEHRLNLGVPQWSFGLLGAVGIAVLWVKRTLDAKAIQLPIQTSPLKGLVRSPDDSQKPFDYSDEARPFTPPPQAGRGGKQVFTPSFLLRQKVFKSPSTGRMPVSDTLFFGLAAIALIFLILSASAPVWQTIAPLAFLQFPWRLLGPAVFCLSVLAGMNVFWLERLPKPVGGILAAAAVLLIIGLASPTLYVTEWIHATVDTSVAAYQEAEVEGLQRATTFSNEYLPATVNVEPGPTPRLLADYADGYPVNKAHIEVMPKGVTVQVLDHGPQNDLWEVNAPAAFDMEVLTYDFPGWTAQVDGQTVPITPSDPHGLITFPVPAGDHQVSVYLGSTPPRDLGNAITLISVVVVTVGAVVLRRIFQGEHNGSPLQTETPSGFQTPQFAGLSTRYFAIGGVVTLIFLAAYMREGVAWVDSPPGTAALAQHPASFALGDQIKLIGYDLNGATFHPGDRVELTVDWYTTGTIPYGYSSFVHISTGGPPLAQADKLNPAGIPTKIWPSTGFIHDDYAIELPADMPPGEYQVFTGLYTCDTLPAGQCGNGDRLKVKDASGSEIGDEVPLARITVQ